MLTRMSNGDICVGTRKGGLYTFDSSLRSKMTNQYFHSNIYALTEDKQGRMWMGTRGNGLKVEMCIRDRSLGLNIPVSSCWLRV